MPKLEYDTDEKGSIILPNAAPFDEEPVLVHTATGWVEAWWEQGRTSWGPNGRDDDGFHWVCYDAEFYAELDDVDFWLPLPKINEEVA